MSLHELGIKHHTDKAYDHDFCHTYEKLLVADAKKVWEIGVLDGASLRMWADYYANAQIIGYDIDNKTLQLQFPTNVKVKLLDQGNLEQLQKLASTDTNLDLIVDDGSHKIDHQIKTFEALFNCLRSGGQYIIEDLHTSTTRWTGYNCVNGKGALQYLNDIIQNIEPVNYPGQFNTASIIKQIKQIIIVANCTTKDVRSLTGIITHI